MKKILLGNSAVARGFVEAGGRVATAYPGTPSTEITEEIATYDGVYAEWSPNEKVAAEVAYGSAIAGARTIVSMKHVGLNVAADCVFTASYTGINAGLIVAVADDPGMHSSQNEQDSRFYARSAHIPMLEPSDSQESKDFVGKAFEISEAFDTPVFLRMTTRVAHSRSIVQLGEIKEVPVKEYKKDIPKYVMVPAMAKGRHIVVEKRDEALTKFSNETELNFYDIKSEKLGVVCTGAVYQYAKEVLPEASIFKIGMVYPLPIDKLKEFASKVERVVVIEELEPYIEDGMKARGIVCEGKNLFSLQGEISEDIIKEKILGVKTEAMPANLPIRPPVMCAGCPHRGIFHILKKHKFNVTGDIGCYTLGASAPLLAIDAVVCMGASIGMAMGFHKARGIEFAKKTAAVIGDSTFMHSGITGLANAVYNKGEGIVIILDNSTTGMTGHQQHPGTGKTIKMQETTKVDYMEIAKACKVQAVEAVDAYDINAFEALLLKFQAIDGVKVIIAKRPCVLLPGVPKFKYVINAETCKNCKACMTIGCPSISVQNGKVVIDGATCKGCGVCTALCKFNCISKEA
ncbi:MAG: indolepyruvate ferredoxin oxidoreductase subunit alpha [Bacillota bacterium]